MMTMVKRVTCRLRAPPRTCTYDIDNSCHLNYGVLRPWTLLGRTPASTVYSTCNTSPRAVYWTVLGSEWARYPG